MLWAPCDPKASSVSLQTLSHPGPWQSQGQEVWSYAGPLPQTIAFLQVSTGEGTVPSKEYHSQQGPFSTQSTVFIPC